MAHHGAVGLTSDPAQVSDGSVPESLSAEKSIVATHAIIQSDKKSSILIKSQDFTSQILAFLSTADNDTLGACLAGLVAITYLVLGRVGLVLIGVVVGIVLHAGWEEPINASGRAQMVLQGTRKKNNEQSFALLERVLDWRELKTNHSGFEENDVPKQSLSTASSVNLDFSDFPPSTGTALNNLADAVIRDYIKWWYDPILPREFAFPTSCRRTLAKFLATISSHLSRKRPADSFLNFITNSSSIIIVFLHEFSSALTSAGSGNTDCSQALYKYLETNPDSNLANVLDVDRQKKKLTAVAEDILHTFLDPKAYQFEPSRTFLRETLAELIFDSTIRSCSKQEWINGWILFWLEQSNETSSGATDSKEKGPISGTAQGPVPDATSGNDTTTRAELSEPSTPPEANNVAHKGTVSRAEYAMEEAMQEAKRLSELIAAEEARKAKEISDQESSADARNGVDSPIPLPNGYSNLHNKQTPKLNPDDDIENSEPPGNVLEPSSSFTDFDQILGSGDASSPSNELEPRSLSVPLLTLHNAVVSIFDDSQPGEKSTMRSKPNIEYLLQIEPASSQHPGWMIARRYVEFENLHEILRRISVVSGVPQFAQKHGVLPSWKNQTKALLCRDLELYLRDALSFNRLAESEGMKRFLEKDQGLDRASPNKQKIGFGFPGPNAFENMGKGMLDVIASAPKGAAGGGKAILGGVTGVFGGVGSIGQKKQPPTGSKGSSVAKVEPVTSERESAWESRGSRGSRESQESHDSQRNPSATRTLTSPSRSSLSLLGSIGERQVTRTSTDSDRAGSQELLPPVASNDVSDSMTQVINELHLPPPPSEIPDDYKASHESSRTSGSTEIQSAVPFTGKTTPTSPPSPARVSMSSFPPVDTIPMSSHQIKREKPLITEQETQVAVELFFAVINELYTLSSAWNIRRTLLNAAKGFLLRPGNPNLEAIRLLLQETIIDANTSDEGIAAHLNKLRENTLPTADELQNWPKAPTQEEKEKMRVKARKLLVEKGMPPALTSVMGIAASGEALGRIFDCLQVEEVARGLIFSLMLQGIKAVTQ